MCMRPAPDRAGYTANATRKRRPSRPDGRTAGARRFSALIAAFSDEIGGDLSESERSLVRQSAALTLRCEQLQEAIVRGEPVDDDLLIRMSGTGKRLLSAIAVRSSGKKPASETLTEYLARRAAEAAELQSDDDDGED